MNKRIAIAAIAGAILSAAPIAHAEPPSCDRVDVTQCSWTVEIDGPNGYPIDVDVKGCAEEDGNVDGLPCLWRDPDTSHMFYVTSENYW